jgi:hypothetical protein
MEGALNDFVLWSGWIAAVGIAIYEIVRSYRNRIRIQVSFTISQEELCISVHNWGRRPVNFVEAGIVYADSGGTDHSGDPDFPFWLPSQEGRSLCFNLRDLVGELRSLNTEIKHGYFVDEAGRRYRKIVPDDSGEYLKELVATGRDNPAPPDGIEQSS